MKLLKEGSIGYDVEKLQTLLKIKVDGVFGPMTKSTVIKFQLSRDLKPDGIVGEHTWTLLLTNNKIFFLTPYCWWTQSLCMY